MSAEHRRPLYAFVVVTAVCAFMMISTVARGAVLDGWFHPSRPLVAPAPVDRAPSPRATTAPSGPAAVELPLELTSQPLGAASPGSGVATLRHGPGRSTDKGDDKGGHGAGQDRADATVLGVQETAAEQDQAQQQAVTVDRSRGAAEKAAERAARKAEKAAAKAAEKARRAAERIERATAKAAEKAQRKAERAAEKAQRDAEKAAEKAQRDAEKAAEKAQRDAEKAAEKAQRDAEKAAEKALRDAGGSPGKGSSAGAAGSHALGALQQAAAHPALISPRAQDRAA